jgi:sialidase-1
VIRHNHTTIVKELQENGAPPSIVISSDEGQRWRTGKPLFENPIGWYCYTAIELLREYILLGHSAGDRTQGNGLASTQVTRVPVKWLYVAEE